MVYEDRRPSFNISGTLAAGISAVDTTLTSTAFTSLPTIYTSSIYMPLTIANDAAGKAEVVFVVGHASASSAVTVVRGKEGTAAQAFSAGDVVRCTPTVWDTQRIGGHAGQIGSFTSLPSNTSTIIPLAGQDLYGGVTVASNAIIPPVSGLYRCSFRVYISGAPAQTVYGRIHRNGILDAGFSVISVYKPDGGDYAQNAVVQRRLTAGDALTLVAFRPIATGSLSAYGSTGYDGGYIELELITQQ